MRRALPIAVLILLFALVAMVVWVSNHLDFKVKPRPPDPHARQQLELRSAGPDRIPHNADERIPSP